MARASKTVRVYEVLFQVDDDHPQAHGGPAGDGTFTRRFLDESYAAAFAKGKTLWGQPARVSADDVPRSIAQRWGLA